MPNSLQKWVTYQSGRATPIEILTNLEPSVTLCDLRKDPMFYAFREFWSFWQAVFDRMEKIHMGLIAAGVAFYAMFAVFPGLAAIIALWSLWFDPNAIMAYVEVAHEFLPDGAAGIIDTQIRSLTAAGRTSIGWASFISFMVATISARAGVDALINGLNAAHGARRRSTIFRFITAYMLTLAIVGVSLAGMATIVIVPIVLNFVIIGEVRAWFLTALPWAGMFVLVILGIGILYRYGPNVKASRTPLLTWGGLFATLLWAAASIGFSAYLGSFNSYNRIYGSIGTVVALLMWFYLAGFSVLLGAVINIELAHRKRLKAVREVRQPLNAE